MFRKVREDGQKYCEDASVLRVPEAFGAESFETLAPSEWLTPHTGLYGRRCLDDAMLPNALGVRLSDLERFVVWQNIERYSRLLAEATSTVQRLTLEKLLAEERAKLRPRARS
jgi:hypothetical protein